MPSGLIRYQDIRSNKLELAKWMRRNMTPAERRFWGMARGGRLGGLHFRRQQVVHGFIADFYCEALGLVVEIDGGIHEQQGEYDERRDEIIEAHGIHVVRFSNDEVIGHAGEVYRKIMVLARSRPTPPLPYGEGAGVRSEPN